MALYNIPEIASIPPSAAPSKQVRPLLSPAKAPGPQAANGGQLPVQRRLPAASTPAALDPAAVGEMAVSRGQPSAAPVPQMQTSRSVEQIARQLQNPAQPKQPPQPTATPPKRAVFKRAPTEGASTQSEPSSPAGSAAPSPQHPRPGSTGPRALPKMPAAPENRAAAPGGAQGPKMASERPATASPGQRPLGGLSDSAGARLSSPGFPKAPGAPRQLPTRDAPSAAAHPQQTTGVAPGGAPPKRMLPGGARPKLQKSLSIGPAKLNASPALAQAVTQESPASIYRPTEGQRSALPFGGAPPINTGAGLRPSMPKLPPPPQHHQQQQTQPIPQPQPTRTQEEHSYDAGYPPQQPQYAQMAPQAGVAGRPSVGQQPQYAQVYTQAAPQQAQFTEVSQVRPMPQQRPAVQQQQQQQPHYYQEQSARPMPAAAAQPQPVPVPQPVPSQRAIDMASLRGFKQQMEMSPLQFGTAPQPQQQHSSYADAGAVSPRESMVSPRGGAPMPLQPIRAPPQAPPQEYYVPPPEPQEQQNAATEEPLPALRPRDRALTPTRPNGGPPLPNGGPPPVPRPAPQGGAQSQTLFPKPPTAAAPAAGSGVVQFRSFEELILDDKFGLMVLIGEVVQVTEATKLCAAAIKVFLKYDRVVDMLKSLIYHEVGQQKTSGTLFRNNSIATHMMTSYTKVIGLPYLKTVIAPEILSIFEGLDVHQLEFEIDPEKLGPKDKLDQNISNLKALVHRCFDRILNSRAVAPKPFLHICNALQSATRERFPESKFIVIAGFLFLRYICPAVVAPDGYKLVQGNVPEKARRILVLLSKILQTIANEREFGDKEEYMMCMNPLCGEYQPMLQYFFNSLAKPADPLAPDNTPPINLPPEEYDNSLQYLVDQVKLSKAKFVVEAQKRVADNPQYWGSLVESLNNVDMLPLKSSSLDSRFTTVADAAAPPVHVQLAHDNLMSQLQQFKEMKEQMEKNRGVQNAGPAVPTSPVSPPPPMMQMQMQTQTQMQVQMQMQMQMQAPMQQQQQFMTAQPQARPVPGGY